MCKLLIEVHIEPLFIQNKTTRIFGPMANNLYQFDSKTLIIDLYPPLTKYHPFKNSVT